MLAEKIDRLSLKQRDFFRSLKHASFTYGNDISDAWEDSSAIDDFKQKAIGVMEDRILEAEYIIEQIRILF